MSTDQDDGPQIVHLATLGETKLPARLEGEALILRIPSDQSTAAGGLADWLKLCDKEGVALIAASTSVEGEDLPPNGSDGFVTFDVEADAALRQDFPDLQMVAAGIKNRHEAMTAGEKADAVFFGNLHADSKEGLLASVDHELAEWWVEMMEVPAIVPVADADSDPDYAPEFIAVPLP